MTAVQDLELGVDALCDVFTGPEFDKALTREHQRQRTTIPYRSLTVAYPDEVKTLDGYPALELIPGTSDEDRDADAAGIVHEISAQFTVNGDDEITMARELRRLIAAARALLKPGTLMPFVGGRFWTERAEFGPTVARRDDNTGATGRYVKTAALSVHWRTYGL